MKVAGELERWFIDKCSMRFCVESTFVVRTKNEMVELFNKIQDYTIIKHLRLIRDSSIRGLYQGNLKLSSKVEFKARLKRMYGDKFTDSEFEELSDFI